MAVGWSVWLWWMARRMAVLCWSLASLGRNSLIEMPGTLVEVGLYVPRISTGASGLGSNESICAVPPLVQKRMIDLALPNFGPRPSALALSDAEACWSRSRP